MVTTSEATPSVSEESALPPTSDAAATAAFAWGSKSVPSAPSADDDDSSVGSDFDSAIGGLSNTTSTASVRSSIYEHVEENGRTYHRFKEGKYPLPNDEQEQERLDLQHILFGQTFDGKLNLAPITDPKNVLDYATGTGIWAIEFADKHPDAKVVGTDLSAIQPLYVPTNCRFEIDDAEDEWVFSEKFDYIHGRAVASCFKDPRVVFQQAFNSLLPGGYLELQDGYFPMKYIGPEPKESSLYKWNLIVVEGAAKTGRAWTNVPHYAEWMKEIGFEDVVEKHFYWPTSTWAKGSYFKRLGELWQTDILKGIEGISLKVMGQEGWTADEVRAFLPDVKKDIQNLAIHAYTPIVVVYGRKPSLPADPTSG